MIPPSPDQKNNLKKRLNRISVRIGPKLREQLGGGTSETGVKKTNFININKPNGSSSMDLATYMQEAGFGDRYYGITMRDSPSMKMKPGGMLIINMDDHEFGQGTHWVAIYRAKNGDGYYFDSFGIAPPKEIVDGYPWLKHRNDNQLQLIEATSCGWYCVWFLINQISNIKDYYKFIMAFPTPMEGSAKNEDYLNKKINGQ